MLITLSNILFKSGVTKYMWLSLFFNKITVRQAQSRDNRLQYIHFSYKHHQGSQLT